jgi:hypothetical protein
MSEGNGKLNLLVLEGNGRIRLDGQKHEERDGNPQVRKRRTGIMTCNERAPWLTPEG